MSRLKRMLVGLAWGLPLLLWLSGPILAEQFTVPSTVGGGNATFADIGGTLVTAQYGDDSITAAKMSNGSHGLFEYLNNVASFVAGDLGVVTAAAGLLSLDNNTVTTQHVTDSLTADDIAVWAPIPLVLCPPGMADAATPSVCATMTDQGAGPSSLGTGATMQWDTSSYTDFRLYAHMGGTGATAADLILRCDTTINMGSTPTTMVTITQADLAANTIGKSPWTAFTANECFGTDVYFNVAMTGGAGAGDSPVFRRVYVAFR